MENTNTMTVKKAVMNPLKALAVLILILFVIGLLMKIFMQPHAAAIYIG